MRVDRIDPVMSFLVEFLVSLDLGQKSGKFVPARDGGTDENIQHGRPMSVIEDESGRHLCHHQGRRSIVKLRIKGRQPSRIQTPTRSSSLPFIARGAVDNFPSANTAMNAHVLSSISHTQVIFPPVELHR
jgi:hypothetical protein